MRQHLFLILLLASTEGFTQDFQIDFRLQKIIYNGDSLVVDIPKTIEIKTSKTTDIIEIGKLGQNRFGIQLEILESRLGQEAHFIAGRVYYIKKGSNNDWKKLLYLTHDKIHMYNIDERRQVQEEEAKRQEQMRNEPDEDVRRMYVMTNSDSRGGLGIFYNVYYFRTK